MISLFKEDWNDLQPKLEQVNKTLDIAKLIIKLNDIMEYSIEELTRQQLEKELVGEGRAYPVEEALYDFDYDKEEYFYKPEVFERYVEIYNSLNKS